MLSLCTTMRTQAGAQLLYNYEASGQTLSRYITQRPQTGAQLEYNYEFSRQKLSSSRQEVQLVYNYKASRQTLRSCEPMRLLGRRSACV